MTNSELIVSDSKVMLGKPVIRGTRITVELILEKLSAGQSIERMLEAHRHIKREEILAAIAYAAKVVHAQFVSTLPDGECDSFADSEWSVELV
ncbi:MAG: DUF433 domain-containing protein [Acidobacteria bacterium]|nr:DUF433 domain-containing protein [Acidobacteriota bacterium]